MSNSISNENITQAEQLLSNYFDEDTLNSIIDSIINFTYTYVETNEIHFLIDSIFDSKVSELVYYFEKSDYIVSLVNDNTIDPSTVAYMKPHELNPDRYKDIIEKKTYEHKKKKQKGANIFSCRKCKQNNCDVTQKQTRSADEPATTFVNCLECGHTFRF